MELSVNEITRRTVLDITGHVIGRVDRLMVDMESWAVSALRVRLRRTTARALGLPWSWLRSPRIEVPTGLVMGASDAVILRAHLDELQALADAAEREDARGGFFQPQTASGTP